MKIAEIVMIKINLGIEFSISIPLDTKVSIGTFTSSFSFPNIRKRLMNLNPKIITAIINKLKKSSQDPLDPFSKALEMVYLRTPKP